MPRLKPEDLKGIKERTLSERALRKGGTTIKITVHMGTCGIAAGAREVMDALTEELAASGRKDIRVVTSGCMGMCSSEPNVTVEMLGEKESSTNTWTRTRCDRCSSGMFCWERCRPILLWPG